MGELERLALGCLLPGFAGPTVPAWLRASLADGLGGVVLYARNISSLEQVAALTAELRSVREDVIIAADEEGGDVTRLEAATGSSYPGNLALGQVNDMGLTEAVAGAIATDLGAAGITMDLAPVADVNSNPDNPVIGVRSFGDQPKLVAAQVAAFVRGLQAGGVAACTKHFPGHGGTSVDSHLDLPAVPDDRTTLAAGALVPFRAAISAGAQAIMTAHLRVLAYDDRPATLSRRILTGLLRGELGFDGVIVTDGIDMAAISATVGMEAGAVQALAAGADAICTGGWFPDQSIVDRLLRAIVEAVHEARLPESRLREAADRVRKLAAWTMRPDFPSPLGRGRRAADVGLEAARRALRSEGPVRLGAAPLVIELGSTPSFAAGDVPWGLGAILQRREAATSLIRFENSLDVDRLGRLPPGRPLVVVVRDLHRHPWMQAATEAILARRPDAVLVETGWPAGRPKGATGFIRTFGAGRVNAEAAADVLLGSPTERPHVHADSVGRLATRELLALMHTEDQRAVQAVGQALDEIAEAVEGIAARLQQGGHLHYFGAGTSGRLAALDALECSPTFGVAEDTVTAHLAGDGAPEDDSALGRADAEEAGLRSIDAAVGISASGQTPYVLAALEHARRAGAFTVALVCAPRSALAQAADAAVAVMTGPEVVAGSTRLKAGTVQKIVLNMLSTGVFTRLGHVYRGRMVDMAPENEKLRRRARAMIGDITGARPAEVERALLEASGSAKVAILMLQSGLSADAARAKLSLVGGDLALALEELER